MPKSIVNIAKNHTLYAQWVPLSYELEFDANGGTIEEIQNRKVFIIQSMGNCQQLKKMVIHS